MCCSVLQCVAVRLCGEKLYDLNDKSDSLSMQVCSVLQCVAVRLRGKKLYDLNDKSDSLCMQVYT